jgi:multidrug efflux pump subunit AcrA (membrane-fusion protein)
MDQTQYKTTKITMSNLEIEKNRITQLLRSGSATRQQYDQIITQYNSTKEQLDFLETNTYVKAPFAGVISAKNYEDGELYSGQPILILTQIDKLKALVAIPETYFPKFKEGMKLSLTSEIYPDKVFPATVEVVYPTVDPQSHTFQCKIVIPKRNIVDCIIYGFTLYPIYRFYKNIQLLIVSIVLFLKLFCCQHKGRKNCQSAFGIIVCKDRYYLSNYF